MELIIGETISSKVKDSNVTILNIKKWWRQLASALKYIHFDLNIFHGNINPATIMLVEGNIKLIHFELQSNVSAKLSHASKNNDYYSSEEKNMGDTLIWELYKHKTDVWGVGCIISELI